MSITAKQIAKELGISATAVSMALNNKPGVSTQRRREILQYATKRGFDFSILHGMQEQGGIIQVIFYKTNNAILSYSPIFNEILDGIKDALLRTNYRVYTTQFYEKTDSIEACLADLRLSSCKGILLLGTEIHREVCQKFLSLRLPLILLDSYFDSLNCTSVSINNCQGAYLATDFLISMQASQPGHLQSSYGIPNFRQRREGYEKAIRENGMSVSHPSQPLSLHGRSHGRYAGSH